MSLTLLLSPMYGGKTFELLRLLSIEQHANNRVLFIGHSLDNRSGQPFSTHNPLIKRKLDNMNSASGTTRVGEDIKMLSLQYLSDLDITIYNNYQVIAIDEAQFFTDIEFVIDLVDKYKKIVYVAALNGDSRKSLFGNIYKLIPHVSDIIFLKGAICMNCRRDGKRSTGLFSHRVVDSGGGQIQIGAEYYISVCRECYGHLTTSQS